MVLRSDVLGRFGFLRKARRYAIHKYIYVNILQDAKADIKMYVFVNDADRLFFFVHR